MGLGGPWLDSSSGRGPEDGRRCRGRPKRRTRDDLDAFMRDWSEKAIQRKEWKAMIKVSRL